MEALFAQLINGLAVGSIYALCVTGLNILVLVGGVFNYAYPHIVVVSMYVTWLIMEGLGGGVLIAVPTAIATSTLLTVATEPLFRPLVKRGALTQAFIVAIGLAMILTHVMSKVLTQGMPIAFPESISSHEALFRLGVAAVSIGQMLTFLGTVAAVGLFMFLLYRTMTGRAFRTMAQDPFVARLLGIPIVRTALTSYAIAGLMGGVTSVFLTMALGSAYPALGDTLAIKCVATILFAGVGNLKGGLICGLILGVAESLTTGYLAGQWANAVAFGMIMIVVMFKPEGLFGAKA